MTSLVHAKLVGRVAGEEAAGSVVSCSDSLAWGMISFIPSSLVPSDIGITAFQKGLSCMQDRICDDYKGGVRLLSVTLFTTDFFDDEICVNQAGTIQVVPFKHASLYTRTTICILVISSDRNKVRETFFEEICRTRTRCLFVVSKT